MGMSTYDIVGGLAEKIKMQPISNIINTRIHPNARGEYLCPFHDDHKASNFKITKDKTHYRCYACGATGDAVNFIMEYDGLAWKQAVVRISEELGFISPSESEELLSNNGNKEINLQNKVQPASKVIEIKDIQYVNNIGTPEELHSVYDIFRLGYSLLGKEILTPEHRRELHEKRFLSDEDIERDQYFTFPDNSIMNAMLSEMNKRGVSFDVLKKVPGFYYSVTRKKWAFTVLKDTSGVGIPIKDFDGHIVGIQIRLDEVSDKSRRYQWFSSAFANSSGKESEKAKSIYGTSPGSPIAVIKPWDNKKFDKTVFVTEGFFKARKLTEVYGCYSLSVQGVTNWKHIVENINTLFKNDIDIKCVYIAFDADMCRKDTVLKPALKMAFSMTKLSFNEEQQENLEKILKSSNRTEKERVICYENEAKDFHALLRDKAKEFPFMIKFLLWNEDLGKGIDDFLNGPLIQRDTIRAMDLKDFWAAAYWLLADIDEERYRLSIETNQPFRNVVVPEEKRKEFYDIRINGRLALLDSKKNKNK